MWSSINYQCIVRYDHIYIIYLEMNSRGVSFLSLCFLCQCCSCGTAVAWQQSGSNPRGTIWCYNDHSNAEPPITCCVADQHSSKYLWFGVLHFWAKVARSPSISWHTQRHTLITSKHLLSCSRSWEQKHNLWVKLDPYKQFILKCNCLCHGKDEDPLSVF